MTHKRKWQSLPRIKNLVKTQFTHGLLFSLGTNKQLSTTTQFHCREVLSNKDLPTDTICAYSNGLTTCNSNPTACICRHTKPTVITVYVAAIKSGSMNMSSPYSLLVSRVQTPHLAVNYSHFTCRLKCSITLLRNHRH